MTDNTQINGQEILERPRGISRASLMTYQESCIIGSTTHEKYVEQPYTPEVVIEELLSVEECDKLRQFGEDKGRLFSALVGYWKIPSFFGVATLERLDLDPKSQTYGCTRSDPVLIDVFQEKKMTSIQLKEFPYSRKQPSIRLEAQKT